MSGGWRNAAEGLALALWVVGTWVVGYLVAPVLFAVLPERALAGEVAGILFARMGLIGVACAAILVASMASGPGGLRAARRSVYAWAVMFMLLCTVFNLWVAQPQIAALKAAGWPQAAPAGGDLFALWHAVSASVYLLQSLLGLLALVAWARRGGVECRGRA